MLLKERSDAKARKNTYAATGWSEGKKRGFCKLKEKALDRPHWRTRFGGGYGSVVRLGNERTNERKNERTNERTSKRMIERINIVSVLDAVASVEVRDSHMYIEENWRVWDMMHCILLYTCFTNDVKTYVPTLRNISEDLHFKIMSVSLSNLHATT
jgi:hypothetical protein